MEDLRALLASNHRQTLEFFFTHLKDVSEPSVDREELLYNASVLAHYAQVSTAADADVPTPASLAQVFDQFVLDSTLAGDGEVMETAGAQCLLLAGFFADQMQGRHNIRWFAELGARFYHQASTAVATERHATMLASMSRHFEPWRKRHARLGRELRDQQYLLTPPRIM